MDYLDASLPDLSHIGTKHRKRTRSKASKAVIAKRFPKRIYRMTTMEDRFHVTQAITLIIKAHAPINLLNLRRLVKMRLSALNKFYDARLMREEIEFLTKQETIVPRFGGDGVTTVYWHKDNITK